MNAYPYAAGHLLVVPYREVPSLVELTDEEHTDLWVTVRDGVRAVESEYAPAGVNVGINMGAAAGGSIGEHLHVHVVPRWVGDSNFMTAVAGTRTIPEALDRSAGRLRRSWPRPS
jgi:ATP adenylyltransferase